MLWIDFSKWWGQLSCLSSYSSRESSRRSSDTEKNVMTFVIQTLHQRSLAGIWYESTRYFKTKLFPSVEHVLTLHLQVLDESLLQLIDAFLPVNAGIT